MLNAKNLKTYSDAKVYINRFLTGLEATIQKATLHERWRLINIEKLDRKSISYKHGQLFVNSKLVIIDNNVAQNVPNRLINVTADLITQKTSQSADLRNANSNEIDQPNKSS